MTIWTGSLPYEVGDRVHVHFVAEHGAIIAADQLIRERCVVTRGFGHLCGVHQPAMCLDADML